jgi:hypothetical protein
MANECRCVTLRTCESLTKSEGTRAEAKKEESTNVGNFSTHFLACYCVLPILALAVAPRCPSLLLGNVVPRTVFLAPVNQQRFSACVPGEC